MKPVLALVMFDLLSHQALSVTCNSSSLVAPTAVADTSGAAQLAKAVNCTGGYFTVEWIGHVALDGAIQVGPNTALDVFGAENGSSYVNGSDQSRLFQTEGGTLNLHNLTLTNGAGDDGGAIAAELGADVMINNCTFVANNATRGGAIFSNNATVRLRGYTYFHSNVGVQSGGALYGKAGASFFLEGSTGFKGNEATINGGGIQVWDYSNVEVSGSAIFEENKACQGGALMIGELSKLMVFGAMTFDSNKATSSGGGMYTQGEGYVKFSISSKLSMLNNTAENGGAIGILESSVFIAGDVIMELNTAISSGGAVYCDGNEADMVINNCTFVANNATRGGAIFSNNATVRLRGYAYFHSNVGVQSGGALYGKAGASFFLEGSTGFKGNEATINGGGIQVWDYSNVEVSGSAIFEENKACQGGALMIGELSKLMVFGAMTFDSNKATSSGGGMYTQGEGYMNFSTSSKLSMLNNTAENGGAIGILESSVFIAGEVIMELNTAISSGGAVYCDGNEADMVINNCTFVANNATRGGAIFSNNATVRLRGYTYFHSNVGIESGGALYGKAGASFFLEGSSGFKGNEATINGGGIQVWDYSNVEVSGSAIFEENKAFQGGALMIGELSKLMVFGTMTFDSNIATSSGGGMYTRREGYMNFSTSSKLSMLNNTAENGGAIGILESSTFIAGGVIMESNTATSSGGAVYCVGGEAIELKNVFAFGNFAEESGGAIAMISTGSESSISTISNCSFEENEAADSGGAVYLVGGFVEISDCSFTANTAGGAIRTSGVLSLGSCVFERNTAYLGPAVSTAITSEMELEAIEFENNTLLCEDNSFLDWSNGSVYDIVCESCGECANNCFVDNTSQVQLCTAILDNTASPLPNGTLATLTLDEGYWRSTGSSKNILECFEPSACVGGSDNYCETGYSGPFCAVCVEGYARDLGYTCLECNNARRSVAIAITVVVLVVILALIVYGMKLVWAGHDQESRFSRQSWARLQSRFRTARVLQGLKIIIVAWQIVTQFSNVASVTYPELYERFLAVVDVFNFNLGWILNAGCMVNTSFYTNLLVATVGPLVIVGLILASYALTNCKCRDSDPEAHSRRDHQHASAIFWISFLVYTSSSSAIFRTFACDDLDTGKSYLRADHSLECYTSEHHAFIEYASVMILIYPIGIPVCYALILYRSRGTLKREQDREEDTTISVIKDLWQPYRPKVFYYEVIECLRRVTLSGIVVFVFPNTAGQVAMTFLLALVFAAIMMLLNPYANSSDAWLARLGHAIVIMDMFVALLSKVDLSEEEMLSQNVFAGVLIAGNCTMVLALVAEALGTCFVTVRDLRHPIASENDIIVPHASIAMEIPELDSSGVMGVNASCDPCVEVGQTTGS